MTAPGDPSALAGLPDPAATVLLFDFDGSLSPIVDDPAAARPAEGVVPLLEVLAARYRRVGVVSGRPLAFLEAHLPESVDLSGSYGLEARVGGAAIADPQVEPWRPIVAEAAARFAADGPPGINVESKAVSLTVHFRTVPEAGPEVERVAERIAAATGLEARAAKMSVELHPPVHADKATAVIGLADGAQGVLYLGDDLGDLPAFDALDVLASAGVATVRAVVESEELPDALRAGADLVVPGTDGVLDLLALLAAR